MIPLRDSVPHRRAPAVTVAIIAACVLAFVWELSLSDAAVVAQIAKLGVVPLRTQVVLDEPRVLVEAPAEALRLWALPFLTSLFLHGGWLHLLGNMWFLWIFGNNVEDRLGHARFLLFYLACGVAASALHVLFSLESRVPTIGASGAIAGVLGAYLLLYPRARILTLIPIVFFLTTVWVPAVVFLGIWFLLQWIGASRDLYLWRDAGGVAYWAHIGGFLAGMAFLVLFRLGRRAERVEAR